jgi:hypothetical protein
MTRLNDTALKAELKKARDAQEEIVDSAVPGLAVRVGRGPAATWSLVLRVRGEGGVSRRGFEKKGRRYLSQDENSRRWPYACNHVGG